MGKTIDNCFRVSNLGMLAFFALNLFLLFKLFATPGNPGSYFMLFVIYLSTLAFSFSPVGQFILCAVNGARRMSRLDMRARVLPVVQEVFLAAKRRTPSLPDRINVRVIYDPTPNAFALGLNTICVMEGMLDMPEDLLAGTIAHEMGHLALRHTVMQVLIGGGNPIMACIMIVLELLQRGLTAYSTLGIFRSGGLLRWLCTIIATMSAFLWTKFCMLLLLGTNRANEYDADAYAFELGYGDQLAEALDRMTMGTPQASLLKALSNSHPEPGDRIGRLQAMGASYSRY